MSTPDKTSIHDINRTNLALDRTVLANERTYAAWIRTGLAALATGLGIAKFMTDLMPQWVIQVVSSLLIVFSAVAFQVAAWRYSHLHIKVAKLEVDAIPLLLVRGLSVLFVVCSIISLVYLWFMTA